MKEMCAALRRRKDIKSDHLDIHRGTFNNYVDQFLPNFYPQPPRVDKRGHFTTPLPLLTWKKVPTPPSPKISHLDNGTATGQLILSEIAVFFSNFGPCGHSKDPPPYPGWINMDFLLTPTPLSCPHS